MDDRDRLVLAPHLGPGALARRCVAGELSPRSTRGLVDTAPSARWRTGAMLMRDTQQAPGTSISKARGRARNIRQRHEPSEPRVGTRVPTRSREPSTVGCTGRRSRARTSRIQQASTMIGFRSLVAETRTPVLTAFRTKRDLPARDSNACGQAGRQPRIGARFYSCRASNGHGGCAFYGLASPPCPERLAAA